jgi:hypothetical protein
MMSTFLLGIVVGAGGGFLLGRLFLRLKAAVPNVPRAAGTSAPAASPLAEGS